MARHRGLADRLGGRGRGPAQRWRANGAPLYDSGDITSLLACRSILDVLATLVAERKLGRRAR